jgi:hypothetical protein
MNKQERVKELEKELQQLKEDVADKQLLIDKIKSIEEVSEEFVISEFKKCIAKEPSAFKITEFKKGAFFIEFDYYFDFKNTNNVTKFIRSEFNKIGVYDIYYQMSLNDKWMSLSSFA